MGLFIYNVLVGHCAEYNTGGAVVQPHYELKCSDVIPPCKTSYNSTDAYLCKRLFYYLHITFLSLSLSFFRTPY